MFQIESNIPVSHAARGRRGVQFPLQEMNPGDSFLIEVSPEDAKAVASWRRKLTHAKKAIGAKEAGVEFTTSLVNDRTNGTGLRVWRTK